MIRCIWLVWRDPSTRRGRLIVQVANSLPDGSPAKAAVFKAEREGKLKTAIVGVDRQTGKAVILPVKVPSKTNIRR